MPDAASRAFAADQNVTKDLLFLKKKKQKDFCSLRDLPTALPTPAGAKVFWLLFFKKVTASLTAPAETPPPRSATK
jgi:hypothetical protein